MILNLFCFLFRFFTPFPFFVYEPLDGEDSEALGAVSFVRVCVGENGALPFSAAAIRRRWSSAALSLVSARFILNVSNLLLSSFRVLET